MTTYPMSRTTILSCTRSLPLRQNAVAPLPFDLMGAELEPSEIERRALRALQHSPVFDPRELRRALLGKVEAVLREEFLDEANDPHAVRRMLDTLLALHPEMLYDAQRSALAKHAMILPADPLPVVWESDEELPRSNRNLYGILPADLNSWEQNFAQILDHDPSGAVTWSGGWFVWMAKANGRASATSCALPISQAGDSDPWTFTPRALSKWVHSPLIRRTVAENDP